jgi:hypothetical protein
MPHYFFHVKRGQVTILDQQGVELADIDEAAKEALRRGRVINPSGAVVVANDQWQPLFEVRMESSSDAYDQSGAARTYKMRKLSPH